MSTFGHKKPNWSKKSDNLGEYKNQFNDPEVRKKAEETRKRNFEIRKARKEAIQDGFSKSIISSEDIQAKILDNVTNIALDPTHPDFKWAVNMLNNANVIKHPDEKVVVEDKQELLTPEEAHKLVKNEAAKQQEK